MSIIGGDCVCIADCVAIFGLSLINCCAVVELRLSGGGNPTATKNLLAMLVPPQWLHLTLKKPLARPFIISLMNWHRGQRSRFRCTADLTAASAGESVSWLLVTTMSSDWYDEDGREEKDKEQK